LLSFEAKFFLLATLIAIWFLFGEGIFAKTKKISPLME